MMESRFALRVRAETRSAPAIPAAGPLLGAEYLFDEETGGGIKPVAVCLLGEREHLVGSLEAELRSEQAQVVLVLADPVGQHLEGQKRLGRGGENSQARQVEDRGGGGTSFSRKPLTASFSQPPGNPSCAATVAAAS